MLPTSHWNSAQYVCINAYPFLVFAVSDWIKCQSFRICIMFFASFSGHKAKAQASLNVDKASKSYSKTEVSLHNKRTDCWIIIKNKVYDVTSYVEEHPGGDSILAHAGDDSTEGFFGPQHATRVFDMIEDFYIGDLEQ
ncbi:hypothetical protein JHK87_000078 [Glycine soja]|nr:hypothetical protein JHK87_000078 [Glycine soja]